MTRHSKTLIWVGLGIYGLLLLLLLSLYRLPVDKMLGKALTLWTETPTLVSAETVSFSLPLSYSLERLNCEAHWPQGVSKDLIDSLEFSTEWSRIFSGSLPLKSVAIFARGQVETRLGLPFLGRGYLDTRGSGIHIGDLSFVDVLLDRRVSGRCEVELSLTGDVRFPKGLDGRGFVRALDGSLESKLPVAGLSTIAFQSISAALLIQEGVVHLTDGKIAGPAVSGTFAGEVQLDERMSRSLLNIAARFTPGPQLTENDLARKMVTSLAAEGEPIAIRLEGTLGSPSIRWEKD
jgi:type II secretion system protein N